MNSLERTRKSICMEAIDCIPVFPILIAPACQLTGTKQSDYSLNPEVMADTLIEARNLIGNDGIYVSRDNWVYHEALGGSMTFPEDGEPYSLAAILRGTQDFMMDLVTESEHNIREFLCFCTEVVEVYGKAMIATGVHGIQYGDSTASLVGPEHYRKFVLPYQEKSIDALSGTNCDLWLHICGKTDHILHFVRELNIQGFEVDALVEMTTARKLLGDKIAIKGNLDTTFLLQKSADAVYRATQKILNTIDLKTGIIMSPGCGVPRMTPLENLRAMVKACEDYHIRFLI